jgi:hypothetical protein
MNKERRKALEKVDEVISDALTRLQDIKDEEESAFDALPEGFQSGEKGEAMQEAIQNMEDAIGMLEDAQSNVQTLI